MYESTMSKFQLGDPELIKYDGVTYTKHFVPEVLDRIKEHAFDPSDIFVASMPKTGTTWAKCIVSLILSEGKESNTQFSFLELFHSKASQSNFDEAIAKPAPRLFMTHLYFRMLEEGFKKTRPKVIYVMRNPMDQMVSFYYFCRMNMSLGLYTGSWDEFYDDLYKQDKLCFGDYFDSVQEWWQGREEHADHILYIKYEDMVQNSKAEVKKMAEFLGKDLSEELLDEVVEKSSFNSMKTSSSTNSMPHFRNDIVPFMRKGKVGDWKNYFSEEQQQHIQSLYENRLKLLGLDFVFDISATNESST